MSKSIWIPGVPTELGVYWFDNGISKSDPTLVHLTKGGGANIHGDYGMFPLSDVFSQKIIEYVSYAIITEADEEDWQDYTCIKGSRKRAWVRTSKGYLGFGLLRQGWNNTIGGTILWVDPVTASGSDMWIRPEENYQYCLVNIPKIKRVKR